ncbi:thiol reductant ABC exporter subunit CydD [Eupransor demetentiae]|uniref:ATPase and permease components (CydD) n=1 Tax=Eupransor demetentiae TaxID=3109584 RepID=A0ABM9N382_9LACO|nr:ABC-type transport system involved in cytochrome bd biosynthesis [Lactobacillaceae bacterium LMG 33000]
MFDKRLLELPKIKRTILALLVLIVLQALAIVGQGVFLAQIIVALWSKKTLASVMTSVLAFAVSFLLRQLLVVLKNELMSHFAGKVVEGYRVRLLAKYAEMGAPLIAKFGTGHAVTSLVAGLDNVKNYFQLLLIKMLDLSVIPWIVLLAILYFKWEQGLFLLVIFPVVIIFFIILGLAAQKKADAEFTNFKNLNNRFVDGLRGLPTLKQLGLARPYGREIYNISEDYRKTTMRTLVIAITSTFALDFFTTLSIAVVAVFLGLDLLNGHMTLLPALSILILAPEYFLPLRNFADDYHATLDGKNALTEVLEVLHKPLPADRDALKLASWQEDDELAVQNLDFAYDEQTTLSDLNFKVKGFEKVAIVGESGSGKTTLLNLLGGFLQPEEGTAFAIDGQSLPHLAQEDWQKQFFYMPQQPYLFHATLLDNLRFYTPAASEAEVQKAVEQAGLSELLADLPEGLQTIIGEGGRQLSGGQAQRVALARMFLDPSRHVLLFDEPTAHLDVQTEFDLKQTMAPIFNKHLVFFATHRLHWLKQMDYVLVMRDGHLVEQGQPEELLAQADSQLNQLRHAMQSGGEQL